MKRHHIIGLGQMLLLLLLLLALFTRTGLFPFLLGALILLLIPWISRFWNRLAKPAGATVKLVKTGKKGKESSAQVVVTPGRWPVAGQYWCQLLVVNELTGEETRMVKATRKQPFVFPVPHCGRILVQVERLWLTDYLGVLPKRIPVEAVCRTTVLPETFPVEVDTRLLLSPADDSDFYEASRRGSDPTEIFQLREYVAGDPVRSIHWKLSSKLDQLIIKEPALPVDRSLLLYWDQRQGSPAVLDTLAEAVFSLSQALSESGCAYTLGWMEDGMLRLEEIPDLEALLEHLPLLLRRKAEGRSTEPDFGAYGKVFYFTGAMTETAYQEGMQVYLCQETMEAVEGAYVFTPENYKEKLDFSYEL